MTYKFHWEVVVHGQVEIEANSGVEAEEIFRSMSLTERMVNSAQISSDNTSLEINYVDLKFAEALSGEEGSRVEAFCNPRRHLFLLFQVPPYWQVSSNRDLTSTRHLPQRNTQSFKSSYRHRYRTSFASLKT